MGNYFGVGCVRTNVKEKSTFGINHLTVIPTNHPRDARDEDDDAAD